MAHRGASSHGRLMSQVREWLTAQGATFTEADPRTHRAERFGIGPQQVEEPLPSVAPDFRVLAPLPFVIEVVTGFAVFGRGLTVQQRDQLLAQRILIGSHFGSALPVVAAVGSGLTGETGFRVPYADATLFVDELPELGDLKSLVVFDPIV